MTTLHNVLTAANTILFVACFGLVLCWPRCRGKLFLGAALALQAAVSVGWWGWGVLTNTERWERLDEHYGAFVEQGLMLAGVLGIAMLFVFVVSMRSELMRLKEPPPRPASEEAYAPTSRRPETESA